MAMQVWLRVEKLPPLLGVSIRQQHSGSSSARSVSFSSASPAAPQNIIRSLKFREWGSFQKIIQCLPERKGESSSSWAFRFRQSRASSVYSTWPSSEDIFLFSVAVCSPAFTVLCSVTDLPAEAGKFFFTFAFGFSFYGKTEMKLIYLISIQLNYS